MRNSMRSEEEHENTLEQRKIFTKMRLFGNKLEYLDRTLMSHDYLADRIYKWTMILSIST